LKVREEITIKSDIKQILRKPEIKKYIAVIFASGVLMMTIVPKEKKTENMKVTLETVEYNGIETEKKAEDFFSDIYGAGDVRVMITYKTGVEKVPAVETKTSEDVKSDNGLQQSSTQSEVTMAYYSDSMNNGEPFIVKEKMPEIEGVVILSQGGGNIEVKDSIIKAAKALFDVPAHKIEVLKMEE